MLVVLDHDADSRSTHQEGAGTSIFVSASLCFFFSTQIFVRAVLNNGVLEP